MPYFSAVLRVVRLAWPGGGRSIRSHLVSLVAVCVVPVWVALALLITLGFQTKRQLLMENMQDMSRSLSLVVERELACVQAALTALATSPSFAAGDLAAVRDQASRLLQSWPEANIVVSDAEGRQLLNLRRPFGSPLPRRSVPRSVRHVFERGTAVVSDLYLGSVSRQPMIAVDVPVFRQGRVAYDLSLALPSTRLGELLSLQLDFRGRFGSIVDGNGVIVATTKSSRHMVGHGCCAAIRGALARSSTGIVRSVSLDETPVYLAYSRASQASWGVVVGVPVEAVTGELRRWLAWSLAGALLLSSAGVALAIVVGGSIAGSIRALIGPAAALGRGEPLGPPARSGTREVDDLARALLRASGVARRRLAERDQALKLLRRGEQRYRNLVEEQTEMIARFGPDGALRYVNHAFCRMFGRTSDELLGRPCFVVVLMEDLPSVRDRLATLCPDNPVVVVENRVRAASGEVRWVQFVNRGTFHRDGRLLETLCVGRDVTERKQAEARLRENQELLQAVVNGAEEFIFVKDREGRFILVNPALLRLLGKPAREILGRHSGQLYADQGVATLLMENDRRVMASGRAESLEESVPTPRGYRLVSVLKMPRFDAEGRVIGVIAMGHDITERRLNEAAQKATIDLLRLCNQAACVDELVEQLTDFFREMTGCRDVALCLCRPDGTASAPWGGRGACGDLAASEGEGDQGASQPVCLCADLSAESFAAAGGFWTGCLRDRTASVGEEGRGIPAPLCRIFLDCHSLALLPVRCRGDFLGLLRLGDPRRGVFTGEKVALLERLLDYAAIALSKLMVDEALCRSEHSLREAQELALMGSFTYFIAEDRCLTTETTSRICGVPAGVDSGRGHDMAAWLSFIHPDHRGEMEACLRGGIERPAPLELEFRIMRINDGQERWLHMLGRVECASDGVPLRIVGTLQDVTERRRAEDELRAYARRIMDVEENLRKAVAAELHDEIGRDLTVLGINLSLIGAGLSPEEPPSPSLGARVADSARVLENVSRTVRNIMATLRPPVLDDYGLASALRWYGELFSRRNGVAVSLQVADGFPRASVERELALFRIAQEGLTNVAKHAGARNVALSLDHREGVLCFSLADDGRGLPPDWRDRGRRDSGWGMAIMRERAELFGGQLHLESRPGGGVRVSVEMPKEDV